MWLVAASFAAGGAVAAETGGAAVGADTLSPMAAAFSAQPPVAAGPAYHVVHVGPGRRFKTPSAAAAVVGDHTVVEIDAGLYRGDVAIWRQNDLVLRGVGGRPHLAAAGQAAAGMGIWVIRGRDVRVENIEFSGAAVPNHNGAGIRAQSPGRLTVTGCYFHHNENGMLISNIASSELVVERSEFAHNGYGDGYSHNIYAGRIKRFVLRFSYMHEARIGHEVKSRAAETFILYNWIGNLAAGTGSYLVNIPDGGTAYLIGNVLQKGKDADNAVAVAFAEESRRNVSRGLFLINNTFISDRPDTIFVRNSDPAVQARLVNDLFAGPGRALVGRGVIDHSLTDYHGGFRDAAGRDFRLPPGSPAIGAGIDPGLGAGLPLLPDAEYRPVADGRAWHWAVPPDLGAFPVTGTAAASIDRGK